MAYASQQLKSYEKTYPTHDLELAVVVFALKIQRHYLYGVSCKINVDHQSLKYIFTQKSSIYMKHQLWQTQCQPRTGNVVVDALNRKARHPLSTIVITQLNLLRELEDLGIQLESHRKVNVQLPTLTL